MNKKLEDNLGKLAMLLVFGYLGYMQTVALAVIFARRGDSSMWQLNVASLVVSTLFLFMILYFTLMRLPPKNAASGLEPRLTAIAGTFVMMLLIVLPAGEISAGMRLVSTVLIILGTILSLYCIRQLGRSFSIMASARELVTAGPYTIIRHPLYGAELVTIVGVVIGHWSPGSVVLGLVWVGLQIRRAKNEERVLRESFPEYGAYARRVPMLVPGFMLPGFSRA